MLKEQIAASLEMAFSQHGFAEPSVAQLKVACNVSLRTLYKHYPSKEAMIVGALEYRHQRYLSFLLEDAPFSSNVEATVHVFTKLEQWMQAYAQHGCLSMNAIAAFPDNALIAGAVMNHKKAVRHFLGQQSKHTELSTVLFLLHEGVSSAWPVLGAEAVVSAKTTVIQILEETA
ncbi:TetR/AcrR family transcriptional regulator [Vibrio sp. E150_011]